MTLQEFDRLLKMNNGIPITDDLVIFTENYELYSFKSEVSKFYDSIEELCADNPKVAKIIEDAEDFYFKFGGGRGAESSAMGGGFNSAGTSGAGNHEELLPAYMNVKTGGAHSVDAALERFQNATGDSDTEYGVAVDDLGYAHEYIHGDKTSVAIGGGKNLTIIHNHPSGGNFSDADLLTTAMSGNKGIIATSSNAAKKSTYKFEKTDKFNPNKFVKAVKKAQWPAKYSYDKGADWWLKKNAKKYGYKYSATGVPNE